MSPVRAVLFDLDGVLVDVEEYHCRALNAGLAAYGYPGVALDDYRRRLHRHPTTEKLAMLGILGHPGVRAIKDIVFGVLVGEFVPNTSVLHAVQAVRRACGRAVAVVSNGSRASVQAVVRQFSAIHPGLFDTVLSGDDAPRKPDPGIYLKAAHRLGREPDECVVVEDRDDGIASAKAAGMRVVVVNGPQDVTVERMRAEGLA